MMSTIIKAGIALALLLAVAAAALVVIISGIVPIKASSGHWPVTSALLDFIKVRSVATHSWGIQPPPLDDEVLVIRGAAHYEAGCYPCHGGPGAGVPPVPAAMTPPPPDLRDHVSRWTPQQLFTIVKHGIKFTGMPAWPAQQRDDEVWAIVAFLRRMPALDAPAYRSLVDGEPAVGPAGTPTVPASDRTPRAVGQVCRRCHGVDGTGRGLGAVPSLAGQRSAYVYGSLRAFADRHRFSGVMAVIAASLSEKTMREVADYYEEVPSRAREATGDAAAIARGAAIAARGIPERDIPSCADCHGPTGTPRNAAYPVLSGQYSRYLALQLELFKQRRRGGSAYANLMHVFVDRLRAEEIDDVTRYYASSRE
jgi:cytochrome c553